MATMTANPTAMRANHNELRMRRVFVMSSSTQHSKSDHGDGLREGFPQQMEQNQEHPGLYRGVLRIARIRNDYLSESGSERFFGDFWFKYATIFCAAGGTATAPLKTM